MSSTSIEPTDDGSIDDAFDALVAAIATAATSVRAHPFADGDEDRAGAYSFLLAMLVSRIEEQVVFAPEHPYFRVIDPRTREGGDNADQRYLVCRLAGGETYRVWGRLGSARRVEAQVYAGDPYIAGGGRMASYLTFEDLTVDADGRFEIIASPDRRSGNWLENPADATRMFVRQMYSDWDEGDPGDVHIDHVGHEGEPSPPPSTLEMADRLRAAAAELTRHVTLWPEFVRQRYVEGTPPNSISALFDPGALGGVPGRWMAHGTFDVADDEALIVTTTPAGGNYQGIQLCDLWFSSLEYGDRQSSLTGDQAHADGDGRYRFVIARRDPGIANWLDTVGRRRGVILLRYDGTGGAEIDPADHPTAQRVALADLDAHLPADTARCPPAERRQQIAARRRHVQRRFGI